MMNALEIIEQIKRLPEAEKKLVLEFVRHLPNTETMAAMNEPINDLPRYRSVEELFQELKS